MIRLWLNPFSICEKVPEGQPSLQLYQSEFVSEGADRRKPSKNSQPEKQGFLVWQILNFLVLILSIMFEENHWVQSLIAYGIAMIVFY